MSSTCLFCRIIRKEIPASVVYEDEHVLAFNDINPQAPMHVLVIPNKHIATVNDIGPADREVVGHLFIAAAKLAKDRGYDQSGYRVVMNTQQAAGQTVCSSTVRALPRAAARTRCSPCCWPRSRAASTRWVSTCWAPIPRT